MHTARAYTYAYVAGTEAWVDLALAAVRRVGAVVVPGDDVEELGVGDVRPVEVPLIDLLAISSNGDERAAVASYRGWGCVLADDLECS